jgi:hypothetical protein
MIPAEGKKLSMSCSIQAGKRSCASLAHDGAESGAGRILWVGLEERGFTMLSVDACALGLRSEHREVFSCTLSR